MKVGATDPVACLPPWPPAASALTLPAGAWDCHAHVIGPEQWVSPRNYDPPVATIEDYLALLDRLGFAYGVLVQVSVHGTDNGLLLDALRTHGDRLRGVVAIAPDIEDNILEDMHAAGVRGVRLLSLTRGGVGIEMASALARRIAPLNWHIELGVPGHALAELRPMIDALPVPVVLAHFGDCDMNAGVDGAQFAVLNAILNRPDRYVKLSAAYRLCASPWDLTIEVARMLVGNHRDRLLWGSDWPHVGLVEPGSMPCTAALVDLMERWTEEVLVQRAIFVENPSKLYGMPPPARSSSNFGKGQP